MSNKLLFRSQLQLDVLYWQINNNKGLRLN